MVNDNLRQRRKDWDKEKAERPDAAPPKELRGVFDPGSASDQAAPPSESPWPYVLTSLLPERLLAAMQREYQHEWQSFLEAVAQAHPEDAPEGPYHAKPSDLEDDDRWMVVFQDDRVGCIYTTKEEIEDIRDVMNRHALNREVREKGEAKPE